MADSLPIFVISDLHLGDGGPRDNFAVGDRRQQSELFLDYVSSERGELVIVGDLFEFWQSNLSRVIVKNLPLLDRLQAMKTTYVLGNHDADLCEFIGQDLLAHPFFGGMCGPFVRKIGDRQFKFMHGHEVDPFNRGDDPGWGRMLSIFAGIYEDQVGSPVMQNGVSVEETLSGIGELLLRIWNWLVNRLKKSVSKGVSPSPKRELTPAQNPARVAELLQRYRENMHDEKYDVAIVGHTHQPGRIGEWYFNTGSWATTNNNFVRISPTGEAVLFDWQDGRAVPNETILDDPSTP